MMKSHRSFLLHYMKEKSDEIKRLSGIDLYRRSDYKWARTIDKETIYYCVKNLMRNYEHFGLDAQFCPQCIIYNNHYNGCISCSYHSYCRVKNSTYDKITVKFKSTICAHKKLDIILTRLVNYNRSLKV